jgi:histidinol-phosphate aminotransferase
MITRRGFARHLSCLATAVPFLSEASLAQHARGDIAHRSDMVWLDANENPEGPPQSALDAIVQGAASTARYHFDEFGAFTEALARSEDLSPEQVLFGIGSSEVINAAICAFTSASRPMISAIPTFEIPIALARSLGHKVMQVSLSSDWAFPVKQLAEEAAKAGGGLIYICNPNNPTASLTSKTDIAWLVQNLPPNTILLLDEAYVHFAQPSKIESAIKYVRRDQNVVVTRTFSKIYGLAGARAGFGCARPDLIRQMAQFKDNIIPILGLRAAMAALGESATLVPRRRETVARLRTDLCAWLRQKNFPYIEPNANFIMIDIGRDVRTFGAAMFRKGVAVGRPFPPLNQMLRVTIGTETEMARFRDAFWQTYNA